MLDTKGETLWSRVLFPVSDLTNSATFSNIFNDIELKSSLMLALKSIAVILNKCLHVYRLQKYIFFNIVTFRGLLMKK